MLVEANAVAIEADPFSFEHLAHERRCGKMHPSRQFSAPIDDPMGWNIRTPGDGIERPPNHACC